MKKFLSFLLNRKFQISVAAILIASQSHSQNAFGSGSIVLAISDPERLEIDLAVGELQSAAEYFGEVSESVRLQRDFIETGNQCFGASPLIILDNGFERREGSQNCERFQEIFPLFDLVSEYRDGEDGSYVVHQLGQNSPLDITMSSFDFAVFSGKNGSIGVVDIYVCRNGLDAISNNELTEETQFFCGFRIHALAAPE